MAFPPPPDMKAAPIRTPSVPPNPHRRLVHSVATFSLPLVSLFLPFDVFLALAWAIVAVLILMELARFATPRANRLFVGLFRPFLRRHELKRTVAASTWVALSSAIAFTAFEYPVAFSAVCFLAFGDASAGFVGQKWGRTRLWGKTLEGTAAFLVAAFLVALVVAQITRTSVLPLIAGGLVAAFVELAPIRLNDNLSIPLVSGAAMTLINGIFPAWQ